jgi:peptide/nickel transport system permease protein
MRLRSLYVWRQIGYFALAFWAVLTLSFFIPNLPGLHHPLFEGDRFGGEPLGSSAGYLDYLGNVAHLDFGDSVVPPFGSVGGLVLGALPWTLLLVGTGTIISLTLGSTLGIVLAWYRGTILDTIFSPAMIFATSIPYYFVAMILVYVLAIDLNWFPYADAYSPDLTPEFTRLFIGDVIQHAVLPVVAVVAATFGLWVLPMRNAMVGVMDDEFMTVARAKGLRSRRLMLAYAARNVLLPIATNFAIQLGYVVGGAVFVEVVFNYPGLGRLLVQSVLNHDYSTVQALMLLAALVVLLASLVTRLLYPRLDPRLRSE